MTADPGSTSLYIGLMSGTSADGMDGVLAQFDAGSAKILTHTSQDFSDSLQKRIRSVASSEQVNVSEVLLLDQEIGTASATIVLQLLENAGLGAKDIEAIGSHGQTIRHLPQQRATWQIGDPNIIAQITGITTVADFRRRDLAAGGEGAPLAPAFHNYVFRKPGENRAVLNIGGMANITLLPGKSDRPATGYDTGPGNRFMDYWALKHLGQHFDDGGDWAASGRCCAGLLTAMLQDDYFSMPPPKSTGPEYFSADWLNKHLANHPRLEANDIQATLNELTVQSIVAEVARAAAPVNHLYICGGGVCNTQLMSRLQELLSPVPVESTDALGIPAQLVEATAFAWLARETLHSKPGNLPSVTGADQAVVLGGIFPAPAQQVGQK